MTRIREFPQDPLAGVFHGPPDGAEIYRRIVWVLRRRPASTDREIRDAICGGRRRSVHPTRRRRRDHRLLRDVRYALRTLQFAGYVAYSAKAWRTSDRYRDPAFAKMMHERYPGVILMEERPIPAAGDGADVLSVLSDAEIAFLQSVHRGLAMLAPQGGDTTGTIG